MEEWVHFWEWMGHGGGRGPADGGYSPPRGRWESRTTPWSPLALGANTLEIFLRINAKSTNGQARVLYAPSANGAYYASATEIISNHTAAGTYEGSTTSSLGAAGREFLAVSDSTSSAMGSVEAEVLVVWKPS